MSVSLTPYEKDIIYHKKYKIKYKDKIKEQRKLHREKYREKFIEYSHDYYIDNIEKARRRSSENYFQNKEEILKKQKIRRENIFTGRVDGNQPME